MLRGVKVLGGMLVLGFVAAADVSAGPAQAQMHPGIAHLEAFLAAFAARPVGLHQIEVIALHFSDVLLDDFGRPDVRLDGSPPVSRKARRWRKRSQH